MLRIIRVPTKPFCCAALSVNSTTPGSEAESNGFSFQIASWDWDVAAGWFWDCDSDDFVVYEDPDHDGWYMLYNVHTGQYVGKLLPTTARTIGGYSLYVHGHFNMTIYGATVLLE